MKKSRFIILLMAVIFGGTSVCFAQDNAKWWQNEKWVVGINYNYSLKNSSTTSSNRELYSLGVTGSYRLNIGDMGFFFKPEAGLYWHHYAKHMQIWEGIPSHYSSNRAESISFNLRPMMGKMVFDWVAFQTGPSVEYKFINSFDNKYSKPHGCNFFWNFRLDFHIYKHINLYVNYAQHLNKHTLYSSKIYQNYLGGGVNYQF